MIQEMADLVTDIRLICPKEQEAQSQQAGISTPGSKTTEKHTFRKVHSPTSSTEKLYDDTFQNEEQQPDSGKRRQKRHRPSALEISCLSNWRHHMFDWTCSLCQRFFTESSGTVLATTFNILDRYLTIELPKRRLESSGENQDQLNSYCHEQQNPLGISREDFQLFCMVSLYIAAKTLIPANRNKLTVVAMVAISQGFYTPHDITATERDILLALDWHVNPPTVSCFCRLFLELFPSTFQDYEQHPHSSSYITRHQCEYLAELALDDVFFLDKAASTVALAVVVLVTESLWSNRKSCDDYHYSKNHRRCRDKALCEFLQNIQGIVNVSNSEFDSILRRLECFF
jgi:hypothetical protein